MDFSALITGIALGLILGLAIGAGLVFFIIKNANQKAKDSSNELVEKMQKEMQLYFENIANKTLKETSGELSSQNKERLIELLAPFREQITRFEKKVEENLEKEVANFSKLDVNIRNVIETGNKLSLDTNKLATALKGDSKTQGRWGELVLERILEISGLRRDEEFIAQKSFESKKPDVVVLLPENRCIYVDAKTSLAPYDAYINATDEAEKEHGLKMFKESVKNHISGLTKKEYFEASEYSSPEYVLMFIPIESCYTLLFADDAQLWDFAWKNKIMPVSPSTLLATLKIINSFHTVNRQNKNAFEIARLAGTLLNKFEALCEDLVKIDTNFKAALTKIKGKGGVLPTIRNIEELGAKEVKSTKSMEKLLTISEDIE